MTTSDSPTRAPALLVTADGAVFAGEAAGAPVPIATGELVFNTAMSGYQEVITDPSYAGQVISFTNTHIGNYGTNAADDEAFVPHCRGVVVCDLADEPSNWRATEALEPFLARHGVPAMTGVDTRRLARHVRSAGAVPCAFGTAPERELRRWFSWLWYWTDSIIDDLVRDGRALRLDGHIVAAGAQGESRG